MPTSVLAVRFNKQHRKADFIRERVPKGARSFFVNKNSVWLTPNYREKYAFHPVSNTRKGLQDSAKGVE